MSDVVLGDDIQALIPEARRDVVQRIVSRTSYAAPVVASYSMDSLTRSPGSPMAVGNSTFN